MDKKEIGYKVSGTHHSYENSDPAKSYFETVLSNLPINEGDKVLDIASGAGNEADFLRRRYKAKVFEMDIAESAFSKNPDPRRNFVLAEYKSLPYAGSSFSLTHCKDAFWHFEDTNAFFVEMRRVLIPKGYAILTGPVVPEFDMIRPFFVIDYRTQINDVIMEKVYFSGGYSLYLQVVSKFLESKPPNVLAISPPYYPKKQSQIFDAAKSNGFSIVKNFNPRVMWEAEGFENNWANTSRSIMTFQKL